jgi:hypothetical protein
MMLDEHDCGVVYMLSGWLPIYLFLYSTFFNIYYFLKHINHALMLSNGHPGHREGSEIATIAISDPTGQTSIDLNRLCGVCLALSNTAPTCDIYGPMGGCTALLQALQPNQGLLMLLQRSEVVALINTLTSCIYNNNLTYLQSTFQFQSTPAV